MVVRADSGNADIFSARAGLKVIEVPFLPMVWFTTVSSGLPFVEKHPELVDRFLRGICEGIAFFKTHRAESIKIIRHKYKAEGDMDEETATHLYNDLSRILQTVRYPSGHRQCLRNFDRTGLNRRKDRAHVSVGFSPSPPHRRRRLY
jgi:hypothetical protein